MTLSKYCKIYPYRDKLFLLFSTKKASKILILKSMLKDIKKGNISEEEKETLVELGFLVNSAEEEKKEMLGFMNEINAVNKTFSAILVMNLDCNLACKYCFEGRRKGKFYMTRETADLFIDFVKNNVLSNKEEIRITFYGGEPLLSTDLIIYISERLNAIVNQRNVNIGTPSPSPLPSREGQYEKQSPLPRRERDRVRGDSRSKEKGIISSISLITNGTLLTLDVVDRLKPLGLKTVSVTLDGPKEIHDQLRPFKSGRGSFDTIVRNVKDVCDMINIHIGGNYTKDNYSEFPSLLDYLMDNGLTPDRISSLNFYPVIKESPEFALPDFTGGCVSINEPWLFDAGIFLRGEILKRGTHPYTSIRVATDPLKSGYKTQKITPSACLMELKDSLVVNYDGGFYKCPGLIGREEFRVGDIKTGIKDYRQSHNLDNYKNDECLNCSYLPLCFGGCRYMKLVRDGNLNSIDCKRSYLDATLNALIYQDVESNPNYKRYL
jgi:uncharacterized protein